MSGVNCIAKVDNWIKRYIAKQIEVGKGETFDLDKAAAGQNYGNGVY